MGLSNGGLKEEDVGVPAKNRGRRLVGLKNINVEKKSFNFIIEVLEGKVRVRLVEKSREKISWVRFWLKGMNTSAKEIKDCFRSRLDVPFTRA